MWGNKRQGGRANKPRIPSAKGGEKHADPERQADRNDRSGQRAEAQTSLLRRRYRAALALLTLLALLGKAIQIRHVRRVQAVVQVIHHLHLFGF